MTYDWRNAKTMTVEIVQKSGPASLIDKTIRRDLSEYPVSALRMRHLDNQDFNVGMFPGGKLASNMDERYGGGQKAFAVLVATLPGKWRYFMGNEINNPRRIPHAWGKEYDWLRWPPEASNASEFTDLYTKLPKQAPLTPEQQREQDRWWAEYEVRQKREEAERNRQRLDAVN